MPRIDCWLLRVGFVFTVSCGDCCPRAKAADSPFEVVVSAFDARRGRLLIKLPQPIEVKPAARLALFDDLEPLTWASYSGEEGGRVAYRVRAVDALPRPPARLRAWLIEDQNLRPWRDDWPPGADLVATLDALGPGQGTAWISAGTDQGVRVTDHWWMRSRGQPIARFDVRFVTPDLCHCAVVPLAAELTLEPELSVALWPELAAQRDGRAVSAVAFVENAAPHTRVWIAAPPDVDCPTHPVVEFWRGALYLGHGLTERRDDRFWYTTFAPAPRENPTPTNRPTTAPTTIAPALTPLRVGDRARIRTLADIARRRFVARVFELAAAGALINAGENDGLHAGQELRVYRREEPIGWAEVLRVQRSYSIVRPAPKRAGSAVSLRLGDALRAGPVPPPPAVVGEILSTRDTTLFSARITNDPPVGVPLAVQDGETSVGVALLLATHDTDAVGFVVPHSMIAAPRPGMKLLHAPAAAPVGDDPGRARLLAQHAMPTGDRPKLLLRQTCLARPATKPHTPTAIGATVTATVTAKSISTTSTPSWDYSRRPDPQER